MDTEILTISRLGVRKYLTVSPSIATRIPLVRRTPFYGKRTELGIPVYSLTHLPTRRSLNTVPLTAEQADQFVDELVGCDIDWGRVETDFQRFYVSRLSATAMTLAQGEPCR